MNVAGFMMRPIKSLDVKKEKVHLTTLRASTDDFIKKLPVHHFCVQKCDIKYAIKFLEVHNQGVLHGCVCAVSVEQFCCAVFAKEPGAWQVKDYCVRQLDTKEWAAWVMEADPGQGAESTKTVMLPGDGREEREVLF